MIIGDTQKQSRAQQNKELMGEEGNNRRCREGHFKHKKNTYAKNSIESQNNQE